MFYFFSRDKKNVCFKVGVKKKKLCANFSEKKNITESNNLGPPPPPRNQMVRPLTRDGCWNAVFSLIYTPDLFTTRSIFVINLLSLHISWQNSRTHNDASLHFLSLNAWAVRRVYVTGL